MKRTPLKRTPLKRSAKRLKTKKRRKHTANYLKAHGYAEGDWIACEECGGTASLPPHHIIFKSQGGSDEAENLEALCVKCHAARHGRRVVR